MQQRVPGAGRRRRLVAPRFASVRGAPTTEAVTTSRSAARGHTCPPAPCAPAAPTARTGALDGAARGSHPVNFSTELVEVLMAGGAHLDQPNDSPAELVPLANLAARALLAQPTHALPATLQAILHMYWP